MNVKSLRRSLIFALLTLTLTAPLAFAQTPPVTDLMVTKSGPDQAPADSDVTYTVTVTNLGPDDTSPDVSSTVILNDPIPAGMTFVSAISDPAFICTPPSVGSGGIITCIAAALAASASANFTFVFHILDKTPPGTTFVNIATATTSPDTDPNSENNSGIASTSTPPPPQADMVVTKTGPGAAGPDTDVVYTIVVANNGPDAASNVTLNDTLPGTMTFVSLTQTGTPMLCSPPSAAVTCTATSYAAGGTTTLTQTGHIPAGTASGTSFFNTAAVSAATTDLNSENDASQTGLTVSLVDVSVTKSGPATVTTGNTVTYTLTIANGGPDTAAGVQLSDPLPPNTTFVSLTHDTGPAASCSTPFPGGTGTVTCVFATLASGASAQFTLVVRAGDTTSIANTASATTESFDSNTANNKASTTTTVVPSADVGVTKTGPATATAGANISYTVTVTNSGPSTAATVSLTDTLAPNTTFVSLNQTVGPAFTCGTPAVGGTGTITCTIATFAPGASVAFSIVLQLSSSVPSGGSVTNIANVSTATADPASGNNSSITTATTVVSADVSAVKSGPGGAIGGSSVTYTVVVTNSGPSDAATVLMTDTLPPNTTFVSENQTTGPVFACTNPVVGGTGTITCTIATFASGASATFSIVLSVAPLATGQINNTATVTAASPDPVPGNGSSTASTLIAAATSIAAPTIPTRSPLAFALLGLTLGLVSFLLLRVRRRSFPTR